MSESQRSLLVRELVEIQAGKRAIWSARAVYQAARVICHLSPDPEHLGPRCCALTLAMTEMDDLRPENMRELATLLDPRDLEAIVELESRAWLLSFASTEVEREQSEDQHDPDHGC